MLLHQNLKQNNIPIRKTNTFYALHITKLRQQKKRRDQKCIYNLKWYWGSLINSNKKEVQSNERLTLKHVTSHTYWWLRCELSNYQHERDNFLWEKPSTISSKIIDMHTSHQRTMNNSSKNVFLHRLQWTKFNKINLSRKKRCENRNYWKWQLRFMWGSIIIRDNGVTQWRPLWRTKKHNG